MYFQCSVDVDELYFALVYYLVMPSAGLWFSRPTYISPSLAKGCACNLSTVPMVPDPLVELNQSKAIFTGLLLSDLELRYLLHAYINLF